MSPKDSMLIEQLRIDEGVRYVPYLDSVGVRTVGVGHNMEAKPIDHSWTFPLTDDQVNYLLEQDLLMVFAGLDRSLGGWRMLTLPRQRVLVNMCFNLGLNGLLTFKNTLKFIWMGEYESASKNMLMSKWANQVGQRAIRLSDIMREG